MKGLWVDTMRSNSTFVALRGHVLRLTQDARGNIAVTFALTLLPIMGFIGAAVDYSRANNSRAAMQAALDNTALMLAKDAANLSPAQITQKANAYFTAMYNHPEAKSVTVSATYTANGPSGSTVKLDGSGYIDTNFMKVVGYPQLPFSTTATAAWGNTRLRVALSLDNTGSMNSAGKMTALKTAAKNLIDQLSASAQNNGDVYISVIPFAKYVNVGTSNVNATWLRWSVPGQGSDAWDQNNGNCTGQGGGGNGWGGGWGGGGGGGGWGGGGNNQSEYACLQQGKNWNVDSHSNWTGCVMDRDENYDVNNTAASTGTPATLFPAAQPANSDPCSKSLKTLSYNWTDLKNKIDDMNPGGGTNQPIGMFWAWFSLMQGAPLNAPSEDANYAYKKVIIHLSDGLSTENRFYGNGYQHSQQVDARHQLLCANIKNAGITLYMIQVNTDNEPTSTVMQNCASGADKFFMLTNANQILAAFNNIAASISKLRLAK
jgi:Flp pilus assembly protein TadG